MEPSYLMNLLQSDERESFWQMVMVAIVRTLGAYINAPSDECSHASLLPGVLRFMAVICINSRFFYGEAHITTKESQEYVRLSAIEIPTQTLFV